MFNYVNENWALTRENDTDDRDTLAAKFASILVDTGDEYLSQCVQGGDSVQLEDKVHHYTALPVGQNMEHGWSPTRNIILGGRQWLSKYGKAYPVYNYHLT